MYISRLTVLHVRVSTYVRIILLFCVCTTVYCTTSSCADNKNSVNERAHRVRQYWVSRNFVSSTKSAGNVQNARSYTHPMRISARAFGNRGF